jgi:hypothetical protein
MEHLSSTIEQEDQEHTLQVHWRRDKVQEFCSKGYSQRKISQILYFDKLIICRKYIFQHAI